MDFNNTEIAYRAKSDKQLKKALMLFKMMSKSLIANYGVPILRYMVQIGLPVKFIIKATLYEQFIGGENLDEGLKLSQKLAPYNMKSILDYATEGETSEASIQKTIDELMRNMEVTANSKDMPFAVFKPSALATMELMEILSIKDNYNEEEQKEYEKLRQRYHLIFKRAWELKVPLMVDAEETWIQPIIDKLTLEMMETYNKERAIAVNTWQMYRTDRYDNLVKTWQIAKEKNFFLGAKFVRGAYLEKERIRAIKMGYPSPVFDTKEGTDNAYNAALKFCMENPDRIMLFSGTHNEYSNKYLAQLIVEKGVTKDHHHIWFSQLFGMCDHLSYNLAADGYNVTKYIPYGKVRVVTPYLLRRAEENSSTASSAKIEIKLISEEIKRRGL